MIKTHMVLSYGWLILFELFVSKFTAGCPRNPQTESLLQLLELPYLLDSTSESREGRYSPSASQSIQRGKIIIMSWVDDVKYPYI